MRAAAGVALRAALSALSSSVASMERGTDGTAVWAPWASRALRGLTPMLALLFFVPTFFVSAVLPYRLWDSLAFGHWSRLIAETGDFSSSEMIDLFLNRPLFYVMQGYVWYALGYHEWLGRCLSVLFGALFVASVWLFAGRLVHDRDMRTLVRLLAVGVAVGSSVFATHVASGMSDVPVAATAAATAALLWSPLPPAWRVPLVAAAAAATVLAKPTGLLALLGIALARLVHIRAGPFHRRVILEFAGLAAGVGAALAYDLHQASRLGESLSSFLRAGNTDYYLSPAAAERWDNLLRADWLGEELRLPVLFALALAAARITGARARTALAIAAPVAILFSIVGPVIADGGAPSPFDGFSLELIAYMLLAGSLLAAPFLVRAEPFGRATYAMLLVWLAPGTVAWFMYRSDQVRFLSPAWPAACLLAAAALTVVTLALARISHAAAAAPVVAVVLLVVGNVPSIDGLGQEGWRGLLEQGPSKWGDKAAMENYAYGPFSYELNLARENVGPGDRIISSDGRLSYFFPGRVEVTYARSCAELREARFFALLTSGESLDIMTRLYGSSADPLAWLQCRRPRLRLVGEQAGVYAAFVVGAPARAPAPAECGIRPQPGQMLDAVFADDVPYGTAKRIRSRAFSVGFTGGLKIERTDCNAFRVVLTGVPPTAQEELRDEAAGVGFRIAIVPAVRYPEAPADVPAMH